MKTLTASYEKSAGAAKPASACFRLRVWHMLVGSLMISLLGWAALFVIVDLAAAALHWIRA